MPAFDTSIAVSSNQSSPGQPVDFDGPVAGAITLTNTSPVSVQYATDGVTWVTVAAAGSAAFSAADPALFRIRKVASDSYPVAVRFQWQQSDGQPQTIYATAVQVAALKAAGTPVAPGTVIIDPSSPYSVLGVVDGGGVLSGPGTSARALALSVAEESFFVPTPQVLKRFTDEIGVTYVNSGTAATPTIDTASPFGRTALKLAIPAGNTYAEVLLSGLTVGAFNQHVIWRVWVEDYAALNQISNYAGTSGYGRYWQANHLLATSDTNRFSGEQQIVAGPTRAGTVNTFVSGVDTMTDTKLRITHSGSGANIWIDSVMIPPPAKGIVALTFDDGYRDWPDYVTPLLAQYGFLGTFGFQQNLIGTNDTLYLNYTDINTMINAGHDVVTHQVANTRFNDGSSGTQTVAQYQADFRTCRAALLENTSGRARYEFHPYVQGGNNSSLHLGLRAEGCMLGRGVDAKKHNFYACGLGQGAMALKTLYLDSAAPTAAQVVSDIADCASYGSLLVMMGHRIYPGATPASTVWDLASFQTVLAALRVKVDAGQIVVLPMSQIAQIMYRRGLVAKNLNDDWRSA